MGSFSWSRNATGSEISATKGHSLQVLLTVIRPLAGTLTQSLCSNNSTPHDRQQFSPGFSLCQHPAPAGVGVG